MTPLSIVPKRKAVHIACYLAITVCVIASALLVASYALECAEVCTATAVVAVAVLATACYVAMLVLAVWMVVRKGKRDGSL